MLKRVFDIVSDTIDYVYKRVKPEPLNIYCLNRDVWSLILLYLENREKYRLGQTCKEFYTMTKKTLDPSLRNNMGLRWAIRRDKQNLYLKFIKEEWNFVFVLDQKYMCFDIVRMALSMGSYNVIRVMLDCNKPNVDNDITLNLILYHAIKDRMAYIVSEILNRDFKIEIAIPDRFTDNACYANDVTILKMLLDDRRFDTAYVKPHMMTAITNNNVEMTTILLDRYDYNDGDYLLGIFMHAVNLQRLELIRLFLKHNEVVKFETYSQALKAALKAKADSVVKVLKEHEQFYGMFLASLN